MTMNIINIYSRMSAIMTFVYSYVELNRPLVGRTEKDHKTNSQYN